ncbi:MAG: NAD-dependent epimerase/dehydratase family protein [bacterium]
MNVLLIGGSGFIGSHLKDQLLAAGHRVRSLDRVPERFRPDPPEVEHLYGEVGNEALLDVALAGIDAVLHLAWCTVPKSAEDDPTFDIRSNLELTTEILKGVLRHRVPHMVFFSSGGTVYGPTSRAPIPESHPTQPISTYGVTKLAAEKYVAVFARRHGFRATILRSSNPYGERQDPRAAQGAITVFLHRAAIGEPIRIWGDGEVVRDYVHVRDLASGVLGSLEPDDQPVRVFNLGAGVGASLNEIVAHVRAASGRDVRVVHEPARPVDVPWNVLDVSAAARCFGYAPRVSLAQGIERTWRWISELELRSPAGG